MIPAAVMQQAIRSWAQRHSDTWHHADEAELQTWLAAAAEHRAAYEKVARAWDATGELRDHPHGEQLGAYKERLRPGERRFITTRVALAAGLVLLTIAATLPFLSAALRGWDGSDIRLVTLNGRSKSFVLDDGTQVLLDADSELTAHMGHNMRRVVLIRGEALFHVSHDASRPFEVTAGSGRVQDLGTAFDVENLADSTRISVLEGQVAVLTDHGRTLLVAGQAGGYDKAGNLDPVSPFDRTMGPGLEGPRHFSRERLGDVLERLARHHAVTFLFADPHLRDLRFSGTFSTDDLDLFLRTLAAALPIEPRYLDPHRIEIATRSPRPNRDYRSDGKAIDLH